MRKRSRIEVRLDFAGAPFGSRKARAIAEAAVRAEKLRGFLSLYLTGDTEIKKLNRRYLGRNRATDVLAFPLDDPTDPEPCLGEVIVSVETARKRVPAPRRAFAAETARYIIHGILHLAGYDDAAPGDARLMHKREDRILAQVFRKPRH